MTIYTANSIVYDEFHTGSPSWTDEANGFDGNFATFAHWTFSVTNDSNTVGADATASWTAAADAESIRIAKINFSLVASGVSASRRGRLALYVSTNNGSTYGPAGGTTVKDEFFNDVTWFGTNATFTGIASYVIPVGVSAANFRMRLVGESPGDNRGFINNRSVTFDIYEAYIDTVASAEARVLSMMLPEPS